VDMRVFLVLVSFLYVGLVRVVIRLKYIPVAAATGMYFRSEMGLKIALHYKTPIFQVRVFFEQSIVNYLLLCFWRESPQWART